MRCKKMFFICWLKSKTLKLLILLLPLFAWSSVQADLLLTAPPRENAAAGALQYGPLATYLSELLGEKVTYEQPKGWLFYQRDIRDDKYDIVFDGPHFVSWRMKRFKHTPVAKLPGKLGFLLVANIEDEEIESIQDVVNKKLCAIAPPNLSTLTILAELSEPARLPQLKTVKGGMKGVFKAFSEGKCRAVILRDKFYLKKLSEEQRSKTKVVYKSVPLPNQAITVSSRVSPEQVQKIMTALTKVNEGTAPILKRFSPKTNKMLSVTKDDYDIEYKLLTGIIFGWELGDDTLFSHSN